MPESVVTVQRNRLMQRKEIAQQCNVPVPPVTEKHLAFLIQNARPFQYSVLFLEGSNIVERTVTSLIHASITRRIDLSSKTRQAPS